MTRLPSVLAAVNPPTRQRRPRRRLALVRLEARDVPATIAWDGGPDGTGMYWQTGINWAGDVLPGASDDVSLGLTSTSLAVLRGRTMSVHSVLNGQRMGIWGLPGHIPAFGQLFVGGDFTNNWQVSLVGYPSAHAVLSMLSGKLTNAVGGTISAGGNEGVQDVELSGGADFNNLGALTAGFANLRVLSGAGSEVFNDGTFSVAATRTLTLAGGIFSNLNGNTLTGGVYAVAGTLVLPGAAITTLAADLTLDGPGSALLNHNTGGNGLANLTAISSAGRLTLAGNRAFTAAASLANDGTLIVNVGSTFSAPSVTTAPTGMLTGGGIIAAAIGGAGTISPGVGAGTLTVDGSVALGGQLVIELNGPIAGADYDQLVVHGPVTLGGALSLSIGFASPVGTQFRVIDNDGADAVSGAFASLPEGATVSTAGQSFTLSYVGGSGNDVVLTSIAPAVPSYINSTVINGGAAQRSVVTDLAVTFSTAVSFAGTPAAAFTLTRNSDGAAVSFAATANVVNGVTVVTLNNFTGSAAQSGSLADGRYTLTALSGQITLGGVQLDGNGDGVAGGNFTFGDAQGLFRFYGDLNGDRRVDISDFGFFSAAFLQAPNYNAALDFNGDGRIDIADFGQFSVRFFTTLP